MHPITSNLIRMVDNCRLSGLGEEVIRVKIKEYLQDYVLAAIYSSSKYSQLVFIGGTALRKLYHLPRMSEDLDFTSQQNIDAAELEGVIGDYFRKISFEKVDFSTQQSELVNRITVKFAILKDVGLSSMVDEKIHIKVEWTSDAGDFPSEISIYNSNNLMIPVRHYALEIMMSGKIAACLGRIWLRGNKITVKGRDYYDLLWYMEQNIKPDEKKLLSYNLSYSIKNVFQLLDEKVNLIKSKDLLTDLKAYFDDLAGITVWCEQFQELYRKYRSRYVEK